MSSIKEISVCGGKNTLFWIIFLFLSALNAIPIFIGFHPHHDGLMLATVRLLKESFLNSGSYPFNQYGSFWTLPFLLISLSVPDNLLLFSMRVATFLMSGLTLYLTYKVGLLQFNKSVARISVILVLLARPIGLEPIPWPSTISMFLVALLTYVILRAHTEGKSNYVRMLLVIGAIASTGLIFTRVQIGLISFVAVIAYLFMIRSKTIYFYLMATAAFAAVYCIFLYAFGWLEKSITDEFIFGWVVASSKLTDRTFPKVSLVFFACLLLFNFLMKKPICRLSQIGLLVMVLIPCLFFFALSTSETGQATSFFGKFWVAIVFFAIGLCVVQGFRDFRAKEFGNVFLSTMGLAAASQVYPLFDSMHAWWGITPASITVAAWLFSLFSELNLNSSSINVLFASVSVLFVLPFCISIAENDYSEISSKDLSLTFMGQDYVETYKSESELLFLSSVKGASVLNLCSDGRVFFSADHPKPASRYFVYWPTMAGQDDITSEILESDPDYVVLCSDVLNYLPTILQDKFIGDSYSLVSQSSGMESFALYGKSR